MDDLLFLAHRIPYPPDKGEKIRAWHFLRHLAERYRIHLAFFVDDQTDLKHIPILQDICTTLCWRPLSPWRAKFRSLVRLADGKPLTCGYFGDAALRRDINRMIAQHRPRHIFVFSSAMAPYVEQQSAGANCVIDMVDVDSEKWRHYAAQTSGLSRLIYSREARTLLALERRAASFADQVLFVSQAEADLFVRLAPEASSRVQSVKNGVDTGYFDPAKPFPDPFGGEAAIVFIGAMNYRPNVEAAVWFTNKVMPGLRLLPQRLSFWIVGSNPIAAVRNLAAADVRVTGWVPDVRPYLARATGVVAPLRLARGIQNKVLEAMAMAAPTIITPAALEGLEAAESGLMKAETADAFIQAIRELVEGARTDIGTRARQYVCRHHSWSASFAKLDAIMEGPLGMPAEKTVGPLSLAQAGSSSLPAAE